MGRNSVRSAAGDVFAICFFHAQDAVYSLSRIALPPPAGRATSHERSNSAEEKIGRCPHQATLRVLGVVASSGLGSLVCVEKRAKLVLQGRSRLEGAAWRCFALRCLSHWHWLRLRLRLARALLLHCCYYCLYTSSSLLVCAAAALVASCCRCCRLSYPPTRYRLFTTTTRETFTLCSRDAAHSPWSACTSPPPAPPPRPPPPPPVSLPLPRLAPGAPADNTTAFTAVAPHQQALASNRNTASTARARSQAPPTEPSLTFALPLARHSRASPWTQTTPCRHPGMLHRTFASTLATRISSTSRTTHS